MIIDSHAHYTTTPPGVRAYRGGQLATMGQPVKGRMNVSDEEIRRSIEGAQLALLRERGVDVVLFSPEASQMGHHFGTQLTSQHWSEHCNDLVYRVSRLFPEHFVGVCQLPQSPGVSPGTAIAELERCVNELGFVGCNLNPDPTGGYWTDPPLTDRFWYPLYEKMVDLDVPAMIHASASCNPNFQLTGGHYIAADVAAFMQLLEKPQLFKDFPTLKFIIPHGGGALPLHWGRYRGMGLAMHGAELRELVLGNVYFDTCVYYQPGVELLIQACGVDNVLFASEFVGAVRGKNPDTGHYFDDTKRYIDATGWLSDEDRGKLYGGNALKVYPRLAGTLAKQRQAPTVVC